MEDEDVLPMLPIQKESDTGTILYRKCRYKKIDLTIYSTSKNICEVHQSGLKKNTF